MRNLVGNFGSVLQDNVAHTLYYVHSYSACSQLNTGQLVSLVIQE